MDEASNPRFDLLLQGGTAIDPQSGLEERRDVAILDGRVAALDAHIPAEAARVAADVSGLIVAPGLIDMHCHLYPRFPVEPDGLYNINADAHLLQGGVTTAVDAGSCGPRDFLSFKEQVLDVSRVRLFAFVNVVDGGMVNLDREQELSNYVPQIAAAIADSFPRQVVGIKTAHYWVGKPFDETHPAWGAVDKALEAGERCHKPVMVDFQPTLPQRSYPELVLHKLRPGDIHTHMYAQQFPVLNEDGQVNDFLWKARERGVKFDLGHGAGSFWFRNAVPAFRQEHTPHTLSTDLYFDNIAGPVYGLLHVLSKFWSMGMALPEVLRLATAAPAGLLNAPELGCLRPGAPADLCVLRPLEGDFAFPDSGGARMRGRHRLECAMTLRDGQVVYDPDARTLPDWETAPASYWTPPGVIR